MSQIFVHDVFKVNFQKLHAHSNMSSGIKKILLVLLFINTWMYTADTHKMFKCIG